MKTIYYNICIAASCLLALSACTTNLPVDTDSEPDVLIMNGYIAADSTDNVIDLKLTANRSPIEVTNGIIKVSVNGTLRETVTPQLTDHYGPEGESSLPTNKYLIHTAVKAGDVVRLEASTTDGQHSAWVEETVPQPMKEIIRIDTTTVNNPFSKDYSNYSKLTCYKIMLKDRPDEDNFYQLLIDREITKYIYDANEKKFYALFSSHDEGYLSRNDVVLSDGYPSLGKTDEGWLVASVDNVYGIFDDARFRNTSYQMTVYDDACTYIRQPQYTVDSYIRVRSINKTAFHYFKALNLYKSDNYDETLSGSMKFPSNVHNGTGIIVFSTVNETIIRMSNADLDKVKELPSDIYQ
jgi:hypothetical protein